MKWRYIHNGKIEAPFTQEEKDHAVAHGVAGTFEEIKAVVRDEMNLRSGSGGV